MKEHRGELIVLGVLLAVLFIGLPILFHFTAAAPKTQTQTPSPDPYPPGTLIWSTTFTPPPSTIPGPFDSLKVGPFVYKVRWYADFVPDCNNTRALGCTAIGDQFINIKYEKENLDSTRDTVLHEILHVMLGFEKNRGKFSDDDTCDEDDVAYKSPVLLMIMRDNPALTKFLLEK